MKLTKSKLKEIVREIMSEDIMDKEIKNPKTGNMIKVRTALQLPDEHAANKKAKSMLAKTGIDKDDVGGPSYPNVPKGAKTSKQAKGDDKKEPVKKGKIKADPFAKGDDKKDTKGVKTSKQAKDKQIGDFIDKYDHLIPHEYSSALEKARDKKDFTKADKIMKAIEKKGEAGEFDNPDPDSVYNWPKKGDKDHPLNQPKDISGDKPKQKSRPEAMDDLDWDDEIEPHELEGWIQDNQKNIPNSSMKAIDGWMDDYEEYWSKQQYDHASAVQYKMQKELERYMRDKPEHAQQKPKPEPTSKEIPPGAKAARDASRNKKKIEPLKKGSPGSYAFNTVRKANNTAAKDLGFEDPKDLVMSGSDEDIMNFIDHHDIPDFGQDFEEVEELLTVVGNDPNDMKAREQILQLMMTPTQSDVSRPGVSDMGESIKNELTRETKMATLKDLLAEAFEDTPKVDKHKVVEGVRNYGIVGKSLYNNSSIMEIAKQLSDIAESAHSHILGEQDDWFDKISVNRNMKSLKAGVMEFQKTAKEAHNLNQRLTSLYEDIGHVLNRYYEIDEAMDAVGKEDGDVDNDGDEDSSDEYLQKRRDAISKSMKNEDKGDMDGDGKDEPDDEEYLDNKDKAIKKAMKEQSPKKKVGRPKGSDSERAWNKKYKTDPAHDKNYISDPLPDRSKMKKESKSLKDVGGVVGIPSLGQIARKFTGK